MSKKVVTGILHLTRHAQVRMQQRGKNSEAFKLIRRYGAFSPDTQNVILRRRRAEQEIERRKRWLRRINPADPKRRQVIRQIRQRIKNLERFAGCVIVVRDGKILTVYDRERRVYRNKRRRRRHS